MITILPPFPFVLLSFYKAACVKAVHTKDEDDNDGGSLTLSDTLRAAGVSDKWITQPTASYRTHQVVPPLSSLCVASLKNMTTGQTGEGRSQRDQGRERTEGRSSGIMTSGSLYVWSMSQQSIVFCRSGPKGRQRSGRPPWVAGAHRKSPSLSPFMWFFSMSAVT